MTLSERMPMRPRGYFGTLNRLDSGATLVAREELGTARATIEEAVTRILA